VTLTPLGGDNRILGSHVVVLKAFLHVAVVWYLQKGQARVCTFIDSVMLPAELSCLSTPCASVNTSQRSVELENATMHVHVHKGQSTDDCSSNGQHTFTIQQWNYGHSIITGTLVTVIVWCLQQWLPFDLLSSSWGILCASTYSSE